MSAKYYKPTPLDFLLLERLPEKGLIGGLHWKGRRARDLRQEVLDDLAAEMRAAAHEQWDNNAPPLEMPELTSSQVMARLRSLHVAGYVENFTSIGQGAIWARTVAGTAFLQTREEVLS